ADARIHLHMRAHARRAVLDAALQRLARSRVYVLDGEGALGSSDAFDRIGRAPGLRRAAVDDAGLVEMDVRFDQPAATEATFGIVGRCVADELTLDRSDAAVVEADVDGRIRAIRQAGVTDDEIDHGG